MNEKRLRKVERIRDFILYINFKSLSDMKTLLKIVACVALSLTALSSCSDSSVLTESAAKKAIKTNGNFKEDAIQTKFQTGYYEVTNDQLDQLAKLQAANVITFRVESVTEYRERYGWYSKTIETKEHNFASVQLTKEGKKIETKEFKNYPDYLSKYITANENYQPTLPEYLNATYTPPTPSNENSPVAEAEGPMDDELDEVVEEAPTQTVRTETKSYSNEAYESAKAKVSTEDHFMVLCQCKLVDVFEVKCNKEQDEAGEGSCRFVYELKDVTPFGYVFLAASDAQYHFGHASFTRYEDLGWRLSSLSFDKDE